MRLLLVGSCCLLESGFPLMILLLHLKGKILIQHCYISLRILVFQSICEILNLLPMFFSFHLLQTFATVCWVHCTVCAKAGTWSINCRGIRHASDVLCRLCPHIVCCRGSAVQLRQFFEQRGCCLEHSPNQLYHHCISACYASTYWPSNWVCCSG